MPELDESDIPGEAWSALKSAWTGYKAAIGQGNERTAQEFASVINGIRAAFGESPLEFEEIGGYRGVTLNQDVLKLTREGSFVHVRFRDPDEFEVIRTPDWAENVANSVSDGSKVRMGKGDGGWVVQSVLVSKNLGDEKAREQAKEIWEKIDNGNADMEQPAHDWDELEPEWSE